MSRSIEWSGQAARDLRRLDKVREQRVVAAVRSFAAAGTGDVRKLQGYTQPTYRLRVGDLRVLFELENQRLVIWVLRVVPRENAYR